MESSEATLHFIEPRPFGRPIGIIPARPNDEGLQGYPFLVQAGSQTQNPVTSGVEFGASKAVYAGDPSITHSERLIFAQPEFSFRDIVLCLRVSAGVRKRCILDLSSRQIEVRKL
jgi:hypothetical protein